MTVTILSREQLHLHITTDSLGFADTSELLHKTLPWVGKSAPNRRRTLAWAWSSPTTTCSCWVR